jgi:hypothetical protein
MTKVTLFFEVVKIYNYDIFEYDNFKLLQFNKYNVYFIIILNFTYKYILLTNQFRKINLLYLMIHNFYFFFKHKIILFIVYISFVFIIAYNNFMYIFIYI